MRIGPHPVTPGRTRRLSQAGFTFVELMVTLTIAAVLLGIAVPSFQSVFLATRLSSYANEMVASTMLARSEAINRNTSVTLCVAANPYNAAAPACGTGGWENGYLVMCATNASPDNTACRAGGSAVLAIQYRPALATGWKATEQSGLAAIAFQPTGTGATSSNITICRSLPTPGSNERVLRVGPTGRASVSKTATGSCP